MLALRPDVGVSPAVSALAPCTTVGITTPGTSEGIGFRQTTRGSDRKLRGKEREENIFHVAIYCGLHAPGCLNHKSDGQGGADAQAGKAGISDPGGSRWGPHSCLLCPSPPLPHHLPPPPCGLQVNSQEQATSLPNRRHRLIEAVGTIGLTFYK